MLNYAHVLMAGTPMSILRPIPCFPVPMSSWLVPYDDAKAHVVPFSVHVFNAGSPTTMLRGILHCLVAICSWQLAVRAYWSTCHAPVCPRAHVEMQPCWRSIPCSLVAIDTCLTALQPYPCHTHAIPMPSPCRAIWWTCAQCSQG